MNNIGCGCNQSPVFVTYPYTRGAMHQCDCCTQMHQPETAMYPSGGYMQENAYMIINDVPYLLDNTTTNYGTKISVSENVYTRISKRNDPSCINLTGSFDLTGDIIANNAWVAFLEEFVSSKYADLDGVLPIQKSAVRFRFYFHIEDSMGGVVYSNHVDSIVKNHLFHYTDINDFFVTSYKNVAVTNIPQVDYNGIYNLFIDKVEVYVKIVDTKEHVTDGLNPYYQWIANHTRISVQHDAIEPVTDGEIMIGACDIIWSTAVQLALTTRLKICFTAYLSNTIMNKNSFGVYKALTEPTQHTVDELAARIESLETTVESLQSNVGSLQSTVENLNEAVSNLTNTMTAMQTSMNTIESTLTNADKYLDNKIDTLASLVTLSGTIILYQNGEIVQTFADIQSVRSYLDAHYEERYDLEFTDFYPSDEIPASAFYGNNSSHGSFPGIVKLILSNKITKINAGAFSSCPNLTFDKLPDTLKYIGAGGFANTAIEHLVIPASVEHMDGCFSGISKLKTIVVENGVTAIPTAFAAGCTNLETVTIPASVTSIGHGQYQGAFEGCIGVQTITIDKPEGSIDGAPWGATNAEIIWNE